MRAPLPPEKRTNPALELAPEAFSDFFRYGFGFGLGRGQPSDGAFPSAHAFCDCAAHSLVTEGDINLEDSGYHSAKEKDKNK